MTDLDKASEQAIDAADVLGNECSRIREHFDAENLVLGLTLVLVREALHGGIGQSEVLRALSACWRVESMVHRSEQRT